MIVFMAGFVPLWDYTLYCKLQYNGILDHAIRLVSPRLRKERTLCSPKLAATNSSGISPTF
jgi:hypothetical protein